LTPTSLTWSNDLPGAEGVLLRPRRGLTDQDAVLPRRGRWSAQPMGDYISGPNHTLPTGATARVRGGLSVNDFVKLITVQEYSAEGMADLGPHAALIAEAEGLTGHAEAIRTRLSRRGSGA